MNWTKGTEVRFKNARWETALRGALFCREGERLLFALPFSPQHPFPLPELMCFARLDEVCGENRIIYAFDERKTPIF